MGIYYSDRIWRINTGGACVRVLVQRHHFLSAQIMLKMGNYSICLIYLFIAFAHCLYEDQIGKFDWYGCGTCMVAPVFSYLMQISVISCHLRPRGSASDAGGGCCCQQCC